MEIMRAVVCEKHGTPGVLSVRDVEKPGVKDDELLIEIYASSLTYGDAALRRMTFLQYIPISIISRIFFGIKNLRKRVLGHEYSGKVVKVGSNVTKFKVGDEVFGSTGFLGGAHSEYISVNEGSVIGLKPSNLNHKQCSVLPIGAIYALNYLKKADIKNGNSVLIYGASGSVGSYAVQIAKFYQSEVTAVCSSSNFDMVKDLGAAHVVDYTVNDFTKTDKKYDIIFDTVRKYPNNKCKHLLKQNGKYISTSSPMTETAEDLKEVKDLVEKEFILPVIDKFFRLEEIAKAHAYVDKGHKKGNVSIIVRES